MPFDNVALSQQNVSFGPDSGRIYSIDHTSDSLVVKTNPGGTLVATIPLDTNIPNEVKSLEYDQYHFWAQYDLGLTGSLGTVITKWTLNEAGTLLQKQMEIPLVNTPSTKYITEAFAVHRVETTLTFSVPSGSITVTIGDANLIQNGDAIYLGPSTSDSGEREERTVNGISGNIITLNAPTSFSYNLGNKVTYRKDLWLFNNSNGTDIESGSLIRVSSYTGFVIAVLSSGEWRHVTAASSTGGNLAFVRGSQYLEYKPLGVTTGYQTSILLENIKVDNNTIIKVYDLAIDDVSIHKLQLTKHEFNTTLDEFEDIDSTDDKYNLDREFFAPRVKSITAARDRSVLFGEGTVAQFVVQVLDQYNTAVLGNAISVQENDVSGFIVSGFESFVTNSNGQGTSRYNTGANPDYNLPIVTVIDVASELRLNMVLDQTPFTDNLSFIEQRGEVSNLGFIEQTELSSTLPVEQASGVRSISFVEQYQTPLSIIKVQQDKTIVDIPVVQDSPLEGITYVEQFPRISDTTEVNQYDFLIFAIPVPYSQKNAPDTNILIRIVGFGVLALDSSTLVFKVNGVDVSDAVVVTAFVGGLEIFYNPPVDFPYSSTVSVELTIEDTDVPPNTISTFYTFGIVDDFRRPFLQEVYPPNNSVNNEPDTIIYAVIVDLETGIDQDSIEMYVEGRRVEFTLSEPSPGAIKVLYEPTCRFAYESEVSVSVLAEDNQGNKFVGSWSFKIKSSSGVLFINSNPENCSILVPVDSNICTEAYGQEDGINIQSLQFDVNGKRVDFALVPKVYRKE